MKTEYIKASMKDNIATAAVLAATAIAIFGAIVNSTDARAGHVAPQQMETIVVSAPRLEVARLDTITVTASRDARIFVASN